MNIAQLADYYQGVSLSRPSGWGLTETWWHCSRLLCLMRLGLYSRDRP